MNEVSEMTFTPIVVGLSIVTLTVLILPTSIKTIGENVELFFMFMGTIAVSISGEWSWQLLHFALIDPVSIGIIPIGIFQVVLGVGLLLHFWNQRFFNGIHFLNRKLGHRLFIFSLIAISSLISGIISVILTAVLLAEIVTTLPFSRKNKTQIVVSACYGMGLGAVLTPVAEPLSTVLVDKLSGPPYYAGFFFPLSTFGVYVIPGILLIAFISSILIGRSLSFEPGETTSEAGSVHSETFKSVFTRAVRVYIFIAALTLLGAGLKPLVLMYFSKVPAWTMYWINIDSAFLDNATLASIELLPTMTLPQIIGAIRASSLPVACSFRVTFQTSSPQSGSRFT